MNEHKKGPSNKKSGAGGKLKRSESVTVRLSGRTKYGAELAGMKKRRTVSSYVETVIEKSFKNTRIEVFDVDGKERSEIAIDELLHTLWDIDESKRFILRAFHCPWLLNEEEEILFNKIKENGAFWEGSIKPTSDNKGVDWKWTTSLGCVNFESLRDHWEILSDGLNDAGVIAHSLQWERYKKLNDPNDIELLKDGKNYRLFPTGGTIGADIYKRKGINNGLEIYQTNSPQNQGAFKNPLFIPIFT